MPGMSPFCFLVFCFSFSSSFSPTLQAFNMHKECQDPGRQTWSVLSGVLHRHCHDSVPCLPMARLSGPGQGHPTREGRAQLASLLLLWGLQSTVGLNFRADWLGAVTLCGHKSHVALQPPRGMQPSLVLHLSTSQDVPCGLTHTDVSSDLDFPPVGSIYLPVREVHVPKPSLSQCSSSLSSFFVISLWYNPTFSFPFHLPNSMVSHLSAFGCSHPICTPHGLQGFPPTGSPYYLSLK